MAKYSGSDSDNDNAPWSTKFKNLKSDAPFLCGGDLGHAPSQTVNTDSVISEKPKVKKRRMLKTVQIKKVTNFEISSGPEATAISVSQRSNKDGSAIVTIFDSPLLASK